MPRGLWVPSLPGQGPQDVCPPAPPRTSNVRKIKKRRVRGKATERGARKEATGQTPECGDGAGGMRAKGRSLGEARGAARAGQGAAMAPQHTPLPCAGRGPARVRRRPRLTGGGANGRWHMLMAATWAGHGRRIEGGRQASLAACSVALGSGRHGPLHCLNCSLTQTSGRAWPGTRLCVAVSLGPGASLVALRKGSNMLALRSIAVVVAPVEGQKPSEAPA